MRIVIVVVGYNKERSIARLFGSLERLNGVEQLNVIVSLDGGASKGVQEVSERFTAQMPNARLIMRETNLGLKKHMLECFKIGLDYDALILLEDDLIISQDAMAFIHKSLTSFADSQIIAGFSLYSPEFNETAYLPFKPIHDGSDCFFMQIPSSWGLFLSNKQIEEFLFSLNTDGKCCSINLPPNVRRWSDKSWKKDFYKYIVKNNKYFLYPRVSLTSNFADPGEHHSGLNTFQVNILLSKINYSFKSFDDSLAIYDGFCEILPASLKQLNLQIAKYDFEVDLYGFKRLSGNYSSSQLVISLFDGGAGNMKSWDDAMFPPESNVLLGLGGSGVYLTKMATLNIFERICLRLKLIKKYHNLDFSMSFFSRLLGRN